MFSYKSEECKSFPFVEHAKRFPFWKAIPKYDTQFPVSSFKADRPAIYMTVRTCRHSRQSVVSNPSDSSDGGK